MVFEKTLESSLDCKEIKPVNPKGNQPEFSLEWLMLKLKFQYFGYLMQRLDSLEKTLLLGKTEGRKRRGWQRTSWLDGIIDTRDMSLSELREMVNDREAWYAVVHGVSKSQTWLSDWTTTSVSKSHFLLCINNIPLYTHITLCLSIYSSIFINRYLFPPFGYCK